MDGTTPSKTAGTVYTSPVTILSTGTLKAIACKSNMSDSSVAAATYTIVPKMTGFAFLLKQGDFWQYAWDARQSYNFQPVVTTGSGICTVTLGAPTTIQGIPAFPLVLSGSFPSGRAPTWKYIALNGCRLMGSDDGVTLQDIFNAWTGTNAGGGFLCRFAGTETSVAFSASMSTKFYSSSSVFALGKSASTSAQTYYPGIGTIATGDPNMSSNLKEYFAPGLGPIGYTYNYSVIDDDYSLAVSEEMGLAGTSFPQTVQGGAVTGVMLSATSVTLAVNDTQQLTPVLVPGNAANQNVSWSSGNGSIASVSPTGLVRGIGAGATTITVTTSDGGKTATCSVRVLPIPYADYTSSYIGTMKGVAGGTFQRDGTSTNLSTVSSFHMSQYLITGAQYTAVTGLPDPSYYTGTGYPVANVNWYEALVFCNKLSMKESRTPVYSINGKTNPADWGTPPSTQNAVWDAAVMNKTVNGYRLPTQAEYSWAAMAGMNDSKPGDVVGTVNVGGINKAFAGSDGSNSIGSYAWTLSNAGSTKAVGTLSPNELGLYDLSGNLIEWVWDWKGLSPTGSVVDYTGPGFGTERILMGGSWSWSTADCALSQWFYNVPYELYDDVGFRVVAP